MKKKWVFTLGSPAIGGGTNVIFEHAAKCVDNGIEVYILCEQKVEEKDYNWHTKAHKLKFITYDEVKDMEFDVAIATWWRTVYELYRVNAKKYIYFVQSIESKFYSKEKEYGLVMLAEMTYFLGMKVVTEATWIKEYLENYGIEVILVHNGIRKDIFKTEGEKYEKSDGLRVLVEGPIDVSFKNVPKTIELVKQSEADEIWLLTSSKIKEYDGVDKVFSQIPTTECAKIYRSCDVLVKLSYVEGMFGPPLEMFHCGGTSIVYDVTGHDEYIKNNYNGIVVKTDDEASIISNINKLKQDKKLLKKLKDGALQTANKWIDWDTSSQRFFEAIKELENKDSITQLELENKSKYFFDIYVKYETKPIPSIRRQIGNELRNNHPIIYKIYRKIIRK